MQNPPVHVRIHLITLLLSPSVKCVTIDHNTKFRNLFSAYF